MEIIDSVKPVKAPFHVSGIPSLEYHLSTSRQWLMWARFWQIGVDRELFFMDWETAFERYFNEDRTRVTHLGLSQKDSETTWNHVLSTIKEAYRDKSVLVELGCLWWESQRWWMAILGHFEVLAFDGNIWRWLYVAGDGVVLKNPHRMLPWRAFEPGGVTYAHVFPLTPGFRHLGIFLPGGLKISPQTDAGWQTQFEPFEGIWLDLQKVQRSEETDVNENSENLQDHS